EARTPAAGAGRVARCSIALAPDDTVSAAIDDAPLEEVTAELALRTGTSIRWTEERSAAHVTLSFNGLPFTAAIGRLLADYNYIVTSTRDGEGRSRPEVRIGSAIEPSSDGGSRRATHGAPRADAGAAAAPVAATREPGQDPTPEDRGGLETVAHLVGFE